MSEFKKNDAGKLMMSLVSPRFVKGIAEVLTIGAKKYSPDNWLKAAGNIDDERRYIDATLRHLYAYLDGERFDKETNLSHLYHAATNLMFLDEFDRIRDEKLKKEKTDDTNY